MLEGHCRKWHGLEGTVEERGRAGLTKKYNDTIARLWYCYTLLKRVYNTLEWD